MNATIEVPAESKSKAGKIKNQDLTGNFIKEYSDEAIVAALRTAQDSNKPVEQLLSISEAVFDLIGANEDDIPPHLIKALWHLEQSFYIHRHLILNP